jgi:hypothetical protein
MSKNKKMRKLSLKNNLFLLSSFLTGGIKTQHEKILKTDRGIKQHSFMMSRVCLKQ